MKRRYVHLSVDRATAHQVGRRKAGKVVILLIDAGVAHRDGVRFFAVPSRCGWPRP
jgi:putative RNA 2'-phosphotransferase